MTVLRAAALLALSASAVAGQSPEPAPIAVSVGGFIDTYYAYDFGRPINFDRAYTTQAARANEFNVNLAFLEARIAGDRLRGRLAMQAGTSVQANYAGEPTNGAISGPSLAQHIQEAFVGYQVSDALWIDGGIFYSNVGGEGWVSAENMAYSRSLIADYSPYYSSGVRAIWQASSRVVVRTDVVNGWQNISESNTDKSVGTRMDFTVRDGLVLSHYALVGNEGAGLVRMFTGIGIAGTIREGLAYQLNVDGGSQNGPGAGADQAWTGGSLIVKRRLSERTSLVARGEWYNDPDQTIIVTGGSAFHARGGSVGIDVVPRPGLMWRSELRFLASSDDIFPDRAGAGGVASSNLVLMSAFTLRF